VSTASSRKRTGHSSSRVVRSGARWRGGGGGDCSWGGVKGEIASRKGGGVEQEVKHRRATRLGDVRKKGESLGKGGSLDGMVAS